MSSKAASPVLEDLLNRLEELPSLPKSCLRLQELLDDPDSTPADMSKVLDTDVGLAAAVLKLANSAHCAIPGGVDSLQRAVCFLGFSTIHQIVLCMQSFHILQGGKERLPEFLVSHAMATGTLVQRLAERAGMFMPQQAFAAGLLHDIGRLAMWVLLPEKARDYCIALEAGAMHGDQLEGDIFGAGHQYIGGRLARKWRYPVGLVRVIEDHHGPGVQVTNKLEEESRKLSDLVSVADFWAWGMGQPGVGGYKPGVLDPQRVSRTGLAARPDEEERDDLAQLVRQTPSLWS